MLRTVLELKVMMTSSNMRIEKVESEVKSHDAQICSLTKEVRDLKNLVNLREQDMRSNAIRLTGFPHVEGEEADTKILAKRVYDRILVPIWSAAKTKNQLDAVPKLTTANLECYRVGQRPAPRTGQPQSRAQPRPILIKFCGAPHLKLAILRCKKGNIPNPSETEKAEGANRFTISEDLTPPTYKAMRMLQECPETESVWTVEGKIRFTLKDDRSKQVRRVKSVFDNADAMISNSF